jgi:L-cystine transport system permease protein
MARTFLIAAAAIPVTLRITAVTLVIALPAAFFMALCSIYKVPVLKRFVSIYVSFFRGTPIVLQILIVYSLLPSLLNALVKQAGLQINVFDINPEIYAYAVFSLNNAALLSEILRSGILTVDRGQHEAALAAGLSPVQSFRRIIIPQSLIAALPNLCNLTITLIKNTSLSFIMTVQDVTAAAKIAASYGYNYVEAYLDIFVIYIIICALTQFLFERAEKKLAPYRGETPAKRGGTPGGTP